jgi:signal transduction histidine kinase
MVDNLLETTRMDGSAESREKKSLIDSLQLILQHTDRLVGITHDIADFTSPQADGRTLFDLNATVRSACKLVKFDKRLRNTQLILELDSQMPALLGHKSQLTHLILNLLINAADAVNSTNVLDPTISIVTTNAGDQLLLTITDNGCGMSKEVQQHAFEAFYTTKEPGKGTGLGLSLCDSIVKTHEGKIEVDSKPGHGTEIRVLLPQGKTDIIDWSL